jgi:arylsulfatase A
MNTLLLLLAVTFGADAPKPNIILFNVDDLGYADIGPFGSKLNRTPNIDRMAAEGRKLTCFYAAPVCSPSRAAMMTGCYPKRVGVPNVLFPGNATGIHADELLLPELLKQQGYATMCIGKWHLGDQPEFLPTRHGFDHYFGIPYSNDMGPVKDGARAGIGEAKAKAADAKDPKKKAAGHPPIPLLRDEKVIGRVYAKEQAELTDQYTDEAVKFIAAQKGGPFFLYLPHTAVHVPLYPGDKFKGRSPNGIYSDWVEEVDWSLGQVLDAVRGAGIADRTLVLFTSDNGGTPRAVNTPLRGNKASTWEGGMREPTVAWWPGRIPAGTSTDAITSNMDLVPTFAKLAGGSVPADRKIDGHDIWPLLAGDKDAATPYDAFYYFKANKLEAVRSGPWKLHLAAGALYNLDSDIGEATDVAAANPDVVKRLQALAEATKSDLGLDGVGPGCRPSGKVKDARPIIDHEGNIRAQFAAK